MSKKTMALLGALLVFVAACGDGAGDTTTTEPPGTTVPDDGSVVAEFRTSDGETYRIRLEGDAAETVRNATPGSHIGIPNGYLEPGDGGVNIGHDWHIVDVEFADMTIELCDGTVSYLDDLGYEEFVTQHGDQFCPWSAEFVGIID